MVQKNGHNAKGVTVFMGFKVVYNSSKTAKCAPADI